ncbi:hypothetical protein WJX81_005516 [Elliptochloris bilobata]|uniref:Uncharacterized protein n=1 Tax=Elliptochloris bilobata TaxID=381761 RepID=A0AAW1R4R7_9CHLO
MHGLPQGAQHNSRKLRGVWHTRSAGRGCRDRQSCSGSRHMPAGHPHGLHGGSVQGMGAQLYAVSVSHPGSRAASLAGTTAEYSGILVTPGRLLHLCRLYYEEAKRSGLSAARRLSFAKDVAAGGMRQLLLVSLEDVWGHRASTEQARASAWVQTVQFFVVVALDSVSGDSSASSGHTASEREKELESEVHALLLHSSSCGS